MKEGNRVDVNGIMIEDFGGERKWGGRGTKVGMGGGEEEEKKGEVGEGKGSK